MYPAEKQNEELIKYLNRAFETGFIIWSKTTDDKEKKILRRGLNLGYLYESSSGSLKLTEKGQLVVDAGGDFSVAEKHHFFKARQFQPSMEIFISHSNKDAKIAEAVINVILKAFKIGSQKIRCTSVPGYKLPVGVATEERLRQEIFSSKVFVAVITPNSINSTYVLFEVGARWGIELPLLPLICDSSGTNLLKGPLSNINALNATDKSDMLQFINDLGVHLEVIPERPNVYLKEIEILQGMTVTNGKLGTVDSSESMTPIKSSPGKNTKNGGDHIQLGDVTLKAYLSDSKSMISIVDDQIAQISRKRIQGTFNLTQLTLILEILNIKTLSELSDILASRKMQVIKFASKWTQGQTTMNKGLCIWVLGYVVKAEEGSDALKDYLETMNIGVNKLSQTIDRIYEALK